MQIRGTWRVEYADGTETHQHDPQNPHYIAANHEVPYRAIDWARVRALHFASQFAETVLPVQPMPTAWDVSLRSRTFANMTGDFITAFLVVVSAVGAEVTAETVHYVVYWFPDGTVHECPHFDCPDVRRYATEFVYGRQPRIMPVTQALHVGYDVTLPSPA